MLKACDSWELGDKAAWSRVPALSASPPAWVLQLHVASVSSRAHGAAYAASRVCLWGHRWGWEAVMVRGTNSLHNFHCLTAKKYYSDYSVSILQYPFWVEIKRCGECT